MGARAAAVERSWLYRNCIGLSERLWAQHPLSLRSPVMIRGLTVYTTMSILSSATIREATVRADPYHLTLGGATMGKADDLLKQMIRFHGKRVAKDVVGDLPSQVKQARQDIRAVQKDLTALARKVDKLLESTRTESPVPVASEDQVEKARFTKRTLTAIRKRFGVQKELAHLLEVGALTVSSWERGKSKPRTGIWPGSSPSAP